jgi:hypothetical protein
MNLDPKSAVIAHFVTFPCIDRADANTGQAIPVDGGVAMSAAHVTARERLDSIHGRGLVFL